jgi:hypothetical protein
MHFMLIPQLDKQKLPCRARVDSRCYLSMPTDIQAILLRIGVHVAYIIAFSKGTAKSYPSRRFFPFRLRPAFVPRCSSPTAPSLGLPVSSRHSKVLFGGGTDTQRAWWSRKLYFSFQNTESSLKTRTYLYLPNGERIQDISVRAVEENIHMILNGHCDKGCFSPIFPHKTSNVK